MIHSLFKDPWFKSANPWIKKSLDKPLELSDLGPPPEEVWIENTHAKYENLPTQSRQAFLLEWVRRHRADLTLYGSLLLVRLVFNLGNPALLKKFIDSFSFPVDPYQRLGLALLFFAGALVGNLFIQHYFMVGLKLINELAANLTLLIYRKVQKISEEVVAEKTVGHFMNISGVDAETVGWSIVDLGEAIYCLIFLTAIFVLISIQVSPLAGFILLALMGAYIPFTRYVARSFKNIDEERFARRDARITLFSQALQAIRLIKAYAWEKGVEKEIGVKRNEEIAIIRTHLRTELLALGVSTVFLTVMAGTIFGIKLLDGTALTAGFIFSTLALLQNLKGPFENLSGNLSVGVSAWVGMGRILETLNLPEIEKSHPSSEKEVAVRALNFTAGYRTRPNCIQNISFEIPAGHSVAIVGGVGAGKTTLLKALLGELKLERGSVEFLKRDNSPLGVARPTIAYSSQEAAIVNGTIRDNLRLWTDAEISTPRLWHALQLAGLKSEIFSLKARLETEIGENGVNLSGGQKQRLALARAYLEDAALILLDDPVSAVDTATESWILERLIAGAWKDKTLVMVTHRLDFLHEFDRVLWLENGTTKAYGTFAEVLKIPEFQSFYQSATLAVDSEAKPKKTGPLGTKIILSPELHIASEIGKGHPLPEKGAEGRFTYDEDRSNSALGFRALAGFFKELSEPRGTKPLLFTITIIAISIPFLQTGWIEYWKRSDSISNSFDGIWIYLAIGLVASAFNVAQRKVWMEAAFKNSRTLHEKALGRVIASPLSFFERTPVGRLVNRFSRDLDVVEWDISIFFSHFIHHASDLVFRIILLSTLVPWFMVALPLISWIFLDIQKRFRPASRDTKRLSLIARSPRYAFFKESLSHLVTIRALSRESAFDRIFRDLLSQYQISLGAMFLLNRWYSARIPWLSAVVGAVTAGCLIILFEFQPINPYRIGFTMMVALGFFEILNWTVREFSELESRMTSWERVHALNALPPEESDPVPPTHPEWPKRGHIHFRNFFFRYPEAENSALQNISIDIPAGQKVAIVGKTGSGKSTLVQSLFRFVTPQSGSLQIDGVNLQNLSLEQLRKSLSYIPQDPIMILGTLRSNLDRWSARTDEEVWTAIDQVNLAKSIRKLPDGLLTFVTENGLNFSRGERQLLCLARALLSRSPILILDEATSSVDGTTDLEIQRVVQEHFSTATVLTIAHRLGTLRHCNRVIELSQGRILSDTLRVNPEDRRIEPLQNSPSTD